MESHFRVRARRALGSFLKAAVVLTVLAGCAGGSEDESSDSVSIGLSLSGSVGDGPIVGATVIAVDADGNEVAQAVSDAQANYQLDLPDGVPLPVTLRAEGGTDLVTGRAPDFALRAAALQSGTLTVNVSPLTTLALETLSCSGAPMSNSSLLQAWTRIADQLGLGWDPARDGDPMGDGVDAGNAENFVLANEALGEVLRRSDAALSGAGMALDEDDILEQIACDLGDGSLDGSGSGVDARVSATFRAAETAVLLELAAGRLEVDGSDATPLMNTALATILPGETGLDVRNVPLREDLLRAVSARLSLLRTAFDDAALLELLDALEGLPPAAARGVVDDALDAGAQNDLQSLPARMALEDQSVIDGVAANMAAQDAAAAPVVSLSARDASVASGQGTVLSWASADAQSCRASGGWSGDRALEGSADTGALQQGTRFDITCYGLGGSRTASVTVSVTGTPDPEPEPEPEPEPAPTVRLTAASTQVPAGSGTTLDWNSTDATECMATGGWSGSRGPSGSASTGALDSTTTFTLTCTGPGGSAVDRLTVNVSVPAPVPTVSLTASPTQVDEGDGTTLSWSSTDASQCSASGGWSGSRGTAGSAGSGPLQSATTFTLTCSGAGGSATDSVTVGVVDVVPPPSVDLSASPTSVERGSTTNLSWTSSNASACSASGAWSGSRPTSGSAGSVALQDAASFTLTCTGPSGSASDTVSVNVFDPAPAPTVELSASDELIAPGASTTLSWSSSDADQCTASGGWSGGRATSGSQTVSGLSANTSFTLECSGAGGNAMAMIQVQVTGELTLEWVAPTQNIDGSPLTDLSGYRIYYGTFSRSYDDFIAVDDPSATSGSVTVASGDYYVAMTALDAEGNESAYSNEVIKATE